MTMVFRYRRYKAPQPLWAFRGLTYIPRPVLSVSIVGPTITWVGSALLDTGADYTTFPESAADTLGLDLLDAEVVSASGVGLAGSVLRLAEVTLRITDGHEFREWPARVGFTSTPLKRALLGYAGVLQFFTATFHGDREDVELTINSSYSGT
jgi:hypothetical protein